MKASKYLKVLESIAEYPLPVYTFDNKQYVPIGYVQTMKNFAQVELDKFKSRKDVNSAS